MIDFNDKTYNIFTKEKAPRSFLWLCQEYSLDEDKIEAIAFERNNNDNIFISKEKVDGQRIWIKIKEQQ